MMQASARKIGYSMFVALVATVMAPCGTHAQDDVLEVPDELLDTSTSNINEKSDFSVSEQVASQYLAVKVEVTKSSVTPVGAALVRGPRKPVDSASKDLRVRAQDGQRLISEYSVRDPRYRKREPSVSGRAASWIELQAANKLIYVPLSSLIDKVIISPAPGRGTRVSSGGEFDPRPWATAACTGYDPVIFPNCEAVLALGIPPPP